MKKRLFVISILISVSFVVLSQNQNSFEEIKKLLTAQETAWNNGDIPAYMQYYWKSDSMLFVGKNGVTYGWQQTLDHYLKSYPDKASIGVLTFGHLTPQYIDKNNIIVIGSWQLVREKGNVGGYFSLLWRKIKGKWKIVIDHTS
ncbi:MAG: nuclear transport factor 2 family protein [Bacteroidetes bacterium]|nr:nuclear transport factor 2 family protein [Bacteroidota bacterium]